MCIRGRKGTKKDTTESPEATDCLYVFPGSGLEFLFGCDDNLEDTVTCRENDLGFTGCTQRWSPVPSIFISEFYFGPAYVEYVILSFKPHRPITGDVMC